MDIAGFADEIALEREHQAARWADGTDAKLDAVDNEKNGLLEFSMYLCRYATAWCPGGFPPYDPATLRSFRSHMIKVATLAYAATRWVDRKLEEVEAEAKEAEARSFDAKVRSVAKAKAKLTAKR